MNNFTNQYQSNQQYANPYYNQIPQPQGRWVWSQSMQTYVWEQKSPLMMKLSDFLDKYGKYIIAGALFVSGGYIYYRINRHGFYIDPPPMYDRYATPIPQYTSNTEINHSALNNFKNNGTKVYEPETVYVEGGMIKFIPDTSDEYIPENSNSNDSNVNEE